MERYLREGCLNHLSDLRGFDAVRNDEVRPGFVRNVVTVPDGASNLYRCAHGGYLMQLVDVAACMAAWSLGKRVVTQQVSLNFPRSVKLGGSIRIEASVVHAGATSVLVETSIKDEDGRTCLLSTALLHVTGTIDPGDPLPEPPLGRNSGVV